MMKVPGARRGVIHCLGLAAAAMLTLATVPSQRAEALSLINPGMAPTAKYVSDGLTTEVRGHGGGGRGGGGGFHGGGGFRGGGAAFHGGGFRGGGGAVLRGGGFRAGPAFHRGGYRYGVHRFAPIRRHHFVRRYYAPSYYYAPRLYCRIVMTYYGPHRICRYRPWPHHRRHHRLRVYW